VGSKPCGCFRAHACSRINPHLLIIGRAYSEEEVLHLKKHGASTVIMGELEISNAMIEDVRNVVTVPKQHADAVTLNPARREL
jgi:CPA2 family monovalent cation:H+ antiporter-2